MSRKLCPLCRGSGVVSLEGHETIKMTREDFQTMLPAALPTPKPPPPSKPPPPLETDPWMQARRVRTRHTHGYLFIASLVAFVVTFILLGIWATTLHP
jgi:hypothetical protein